MISEDGQVVKFNTPDAAFKCTYNTTIKVINQCLDARNVPNLDSSWRYTVLRGATIRLFCFRSVVQMGQGFLNYRLTLQLRKRASILCVIQDVSGGL